MPYRNSKDMLTDTLQILQARTVLLLDALATSETRFLRIFFVTGRKIFVETRFLAPYAPRTGICEKTWFLTSARSVRIYL